MTHIKYTPWTVDYTSTFDILFKDFFNTNSTFVSPIDQKIGHPVDIYENEVLWPGLKNWLIKRNFYPVTEPLENHTDVLFKKTISSNFGCYCHIKLYINKKSFH